MNDCCAVMIPGRRGLQGDPAAPGVDGINAFTLTTAQFEMPAVGDSVDISVEEGSWASPNGGAIVGQAVHVQFAGYFYVLALPDATTMTLVNLGYDENAAAGTIIPPASKVSPAGVRGPSGAEVIGVLLAANNLSDVADIPTSLANLGIGTAGLEDKGNALAQIPFVDDAAGLTAGEAVFATVFGLESKAATPALAALGVVLGNTDDDVPQVDQAAGLTAGQAVFATAAGLESKTAAAARTALGMPAATVAFRADLNGVPSAAIGVGVATKMDLTTVRFDTSGSWMNVATDRFTPVTPGYYFLQASSLWQEGAGIAGLAFVYIKKNGTEIARGSVFLSDTFINSQPVTVSALVNANGTDYFEVWVMTANGSTNLDGNVNETYFSGFAVA